MRKHPNRISMPWRGRSTLSSSAAWMPNADDVDKGRVVVEPPLWTRRERRKDD
jgi:hypothetical protein